MNIFACLLVLFAGNALVAGQSIDQYIQSKGGRVVEGHLNPGSPKDRYFKSLLSKHKEIETIAETGFNAGHSSNCFLSASAGVQVVSFDILQWAYCTLAKEYIDLSYPNRHVLIAGDSLETIPEFHKAHPDMKFDLIFIDGGHEYSVAKGDIVNFRNLAHENTIVVVDDAQAPDVKRAWQEAIKEGIVEQTAYFKAPDADWVQGRYTW